MKTIVKFLKAVYSTVVEARRAQAKLHNAAWE
jgi:hypothetical protein